MRKSPTIGAALAAVVLVTASSSAQSRDCGVRDTASVSQWAGVLLDAEDAEVRQSLGLSRISPTDPQAVITDGNLCREVVRVAEARLSSEPIWSFTQRSGWTYTVLRFGPYLALSFREGPPCHRRAKSDTLPR